VNLELTLSLNSSQNRSKTTNHAITEMEVVGVDAGLDTVAKSGPGGSNSALVMKKGRGRPRKSEVGENPLSPAKLPPRISIQPSGSEEKRGRGRPRGSGKMQILAPIGMSFFSLIFFLFSFIFFMIILLFLILLCWFESSFLTFISVWNDCALCFFFFFAFEFDTFFIFNCVDFVIKSNPNDGT